METVSPGSRGVTHRPPPFGMTGGHATLSNPPGTHHTSPHGCQGSRVIGGEACPTQLQRENVRHSRLLHQGVKERLQSVVRLGRDKLEKCWQSAVGGRAVLSCQGAVSGLQGHNLSLLLSDWASPVSSFSSYLSHFYPAFLLTSSIRDVSPPRLPMWAYAPCPRAKADARLTRAISAYAKPRIPSQLEPLMKNLSDSVMAAMFARTVTFGP